MSQLPFFDANILVYAALGGGEPRADEARALIRSGGVISAQSLNEFASVLRLKLRRCSWAEVLNAEADIREPLPLIAPLSIETHERALAVARRYDYRFIRLAAEPPAEEPDSAAA